MPDIQKDETNPEKKLPSHAKVVVIGGGVVGCSILFHLAKFRCTPLKLKLRKLSFFVHFHQSFEYPLFFNDAICVLLLYK